MILLEERQTLPRRDDDIALGWLQLSGENLQKGRFSRAVGANQAIAVSFGKLDINIFKQGLLADP